MKYGPIFTSACTFLKHAHFLYDKNRPHVQKTENRAGKLKSTPIQPRVTHHFNSRWLCSLVWNALFLILLFRFSAHQSSLSHAANILFLWIYRPLNNPCNCELRSTRLAAAAIIISQLVPWQRNRQIFESFPVGEHVRHDPRAILLRDWLRARCTAQ